LIAGGRGKYEKLRAYSRKLLKHSAAYGGEGRRMGRMESEGGVHFECQGLLPPLRPWIRVKAAALLCVA
jgi:hypothetical protein